PPSRSSATLSSGPAPTRSRAGPARSCATSSVSRSSACPASRGSTRTSPGSRSRAASRSDSELDHEAAAGATRLEDAMSLARLVGAERPRHPQRDGALLDLLAEPVELALLAGVLPHPHHVVGDASFR